MTERYMKATGVQYNDAQPLLDITAPREMVRVEVDHHRNVLYVHVGAVTILRICRITGKVIIEELA